MSSTTIEDIKSNSAVVKVHLPTPGTTFGISINNNEFDDPLTRQLVDKKIIQPTKIPGDSDVTFNLTNLTPNKTYKVYADYLIGNDNRPSLISFVKKETKYIHLGVGPNSFAISNNGKEWTGGGKRSVINESCNCGLWDGTNWYIGGSGTNTIASSTDCKTWEPYSTPLYKVNGIAYRSVSGTYIGVGEGESDYIMYSSNGTTWKGLGKDVGTSSELKDIATDGTMFVAVGSDIVYSLDGTTWISTLVVNTNLRRIYYNGLYWIALGPSMLAYSTNGVIWNTSQNTLGLLSITWNGTSWIGVNGRKSYLSPDGITWTDSPYNNCECSEIVYGDDGTIVGGMAGLLPGTSVAQYSMTNGQNWATTERELITSTLRIIYKRVLPYIPTTFATLPVSCQTMDLLANNPPSGQFALGLNTINFTFPTNAPQSLPQFPNTLFPYEFYGNGYGSSSIPRDPTMFQTYVGILQNTKQQILFPNFSTRADLSVSNIDYGFGFACGPSTKSIELIIGGRRRAIITQTDKINYDTVPQRTFDGNGNLLSTTYRIISRTNQFTSILSSQTNDAQVTETTGPIGDPINVSPNIYKYIEKLFPNNLVSRLTSSNAEALKTSYTAAQSQFQSDSRNLFKYAAKDGTQSDVLAILPRIGYQRKGAIQYIDAANAYLPVKYASYSDQIRYTSISDDVIVYLQPFPLDNVTLDNANLSIVSSSGYVYFFYNERIIAIVRQAFTYVNTKYNTFLNQKYVSYSTGIKASELIGVERISIVGGKDVFTGYNVTSNLPASFIEGTNNILPIQLPVSFESMFKYRVMGINNIYDPRKGYYFLSNNTFDGLSLRLFQGLGFSPCIESKIYASNYFLRNFLTSTEHQSIFEFMFTKAKSTTNTSLRGLQDIFETFSFTKQTSLYAKTIINLWILMLDSTSLNETLSNACGLFDGINLFAPQIQNEINGIKTVYNNNINQFIQDIHTQVLTNIDEYAALSNIVTKLFVTTYSYTDLGSLTTTNYDTATDISYLNTVMSTLIQNLTSLFTNASGFYIIDHIQPLISTFSDMKNLYKEICDPLTSLRLYGIQSNFNKYISENSDFINSTEFASAIIQDSNTQTQIRNTYNFLQTYTFNDSTNIYGRNQFVPLKQAMLARYNLIPTFLGDFNSLATVSTAPLQAILNNIIGVVSITKIQEIQNTLSLAILNVIEPYNVGVFDRETTIPLEIFSDYTPSLPDRALLGLPVPSVYEDERTFSLLYNGIRLTLRTTPTFTYQTLITELEYQIKNIRLRDDLTSSAQLPLPYRALISSRFISFSITRRGDPTTGFPNTVFTTDKYHLQFTWTITPPSADDQTPEALSYRAHTGVLTGLQNVSDTIQFTDTYSSLYLGFGEEIVDSAGNQIVHTMTGLTPISPYPFLMQSCKAEFYLDNFSRLVSNINYLKTFTTIIPAAIDACKIIFDEYFAIGADKFYATIHGVLHNYEANIYDESFIRGHGACNFDNLNNRRNVFARVSTLIVFNKAGYDNEKRLNTLTFVNRFTYLSEVIALLAECKVIDDYFTTARAGFKKYADTVKLINTKTSSLLESVMRQQIMYNEYISDTPPQIIIYDGIGEDFIMSVLPTDTRFWTTKQGENFLRFPEFRSNWPYYDQDIVSYDGKVYQCTGLAFSGIDPPNSDYWALTTDYTTDQLGVANLYNKYARYNAYSFVFCERKNTGQTGPIKYDGYISKFRIDKPDLLEYTHGSPYVRKNIQLGFRNLKASLQQVDTSYNRLEYARNQQDYSSQVGPLLSELIRDFIGSRGYTSTTWTYYVKQAHLDVYPTFQKWAKDYNGQTIDNWTDARTIGFLSREYERTVGLRYFGYDTTRADHYVTDIKSIVDYIVNLQPDGKSKAPGSNVYIMSPLNYDETRTGLYLEMLPYISIRDKEGIFKAVFSAMSESEMNLNSFSYRNAQESSVFLQDYNLSDAKANGIDSFSVNIVKANILYSYFMYQGDTTNIKITDFPDHKEKLGNINVTNQNTNSTRNVIGYDPPTYPFIWKLISVPVYDSTRKYILNDVVAVNYSIGQGTTGEANTFSLVEYKCQQVTSAGYVQGVNPSSDLVYWTQVGSTNVFYNWFPIPYSMELDSPSGLYAQDGVKKYMAVSPKARSPTRIVRYQARGIYADAPVNEIEEGYWKEVETYVYTTGDIVYYKDGATLKQYMALQDNSELKPLLFPFWIELPLSMGNIIQRSTATGPTGSTQPTGVTGATGSHYPTYDPTVIYNLGEIVYYPNYSSRLYDKYQCINVDVPLKGGTDMTLQQNADYIDGVSPTDDTENLLWREENIYYSQRSLLNTYKINTTKFDTSVDSIQNALIVQNCNNGIFINENRSSGTTHLADSVGLQKYSIVMRYGGHIKVNNIVYVCRPAPYGISRKIFSSYGKVPHFTNPNRYENITIDMIKKIYTESEVAAIYEEALTITTEPLFKNGDCYMNSLGIIFFCKGGDFISPTYIERNRITKVEADGTYSMTVENIMDWTAPYYSNRLIELTKSYSNNGNRSKIRQNDGPEIYLSDYTYVKGNKILHPKFESSSVIDLSTLTYIGATPLEQYPPTTPTFFAYYPYAYDGAYPIPSSPSLDNGKIDTRYDPYAVTPLRTSNFQPNDAIYCSADKAIYIWNGFRWVFGFKIGVYKLYRAPTNFGHYLLYEGTYKLRDRPRYGIGPKSDMWRTPGFLRSMRYEYALQIEHPKMEIRSKMCLLKEMLMDNTEYDIRTFPFKECDYNETWQKLKNGYATIDTSKCIGLYPTTSSVIYNPSEKVPKSGPSGSPGSIIGPLSYTGGTGTSLQNIYNVPNPVDSALNLLINTINKEILDIYALILQKRTTINNLKMIFYSKDYISDLVKSDTYKYLFINSDTNRPVDLGFGSKNSTCTPDDLRDYMLDQINRNILKFKSLQYRMAEFRYNDSGLPLGQTNAALNTIRQNVKTSVPVISELQLLQIAQNEICILESEITDAIAYCRGMIGYDQLDLMLQYTHDGSIKFGIGGICDRNWDATCYTDGVVIPLRGIDLNHNFMYTWIPPTDGSATTTGFGDSLTNSIVTLQNNYTIFSENDYRNQIIAPRRSDAGDYIGGGAGALGGALAGLVGISVVNPNATRHASYTKYSALWNNTRALHTVYVGQYKRVPSIPLDRLTETTSLNNPDIINKAARWGIAKAITKASDLKGRLGIPTPSPAAPTLYSVPPVAIPPYNPEPRRIETEWARSVEAASVRSLPQSQIPIEPAPPTPPTLLPITEPGNPSPPIIPPEPADAPLKPLPEPKISPADLKAVNDFRPALTKGSVTYVNGKKVTIEGATWTPPAVKAAQARIDEARAAFNADPKNAAEVARIKANNAQIEADNLAARQAYNNGTSPDMVKYNADLARYNTAQAANERILAQNTNNNELNIKSIKAAGLVAEGNYDINTGKLRNIVRVPPTTGPAGDAPITGLESLESLGLRPAKSTTTVGDYAPFVQSLSRQDTTPGARIPDPVVGNILAQGASATLPPARLSTPDPVSASSRNLSLAAKPLPSATPIPAEATPASPSEKHRLTKLAEDYNNYRKAAKAKAAEAEARKNAFFKNLNASDVNKPTPTIQREISNSKLQSAKTAKAVAGALAGGVMTAISVMGTSSAVFGLLGSMDKPNGLLDFLSDPNSLGSIVGLLPGNIGAVGSIACSIGAIGVALANGDASGIVTAMLNTIVGVISLALPVVGMVLGVFMSFASNVQNGEWLSDTQY